MTCGSSYTINKVTKTFDYYNTYTQSSAGQTSDANGPSTTLIEANVQYIAHIPNVLQAAHDPSVGYLVDSF